MLCTKFRLRSPAAAAALMVVGPLLLAAAPSDEAAVRAAYQQLERSIRDGDGAAWLRLLDAVTLAAMPDDVKQNWRSGRFRDPSIRYEVIALRVEGDEAAVLGKISSSQGGAHVQFHSVIFVREMDEWKLGSEQYNDRPIDPSALYALVPTRGGAFTLARTPWTSITQTSIGGRQSGGTQAPWNLRAIRDSDFVYLRCEALKTLPPPGTEIPKPANSAVANTGVPSVPVLRLKLGSAERGVYAQEYEVHLGAVVQTRAAFDPSTRAYQNRYFVQYSLSVNAVRSNETVDLFDNHTGDRFTRLIAVDGSAIAVKLPLRALSTKTPASVTLEDGNRPASFSPFVISVFAR